MNDIDFDKKYNTAVQQYVGFINDIFAIFKERKVPIQKEKLKNFDLIKFYNVEIIIKAVYFRIDENKKGDILNIDFIRIEKDFNGKINEKPIFTVKYNDYCYIDDSLTDEVELLTKVIDRLFDYMRHTNIPIYSVNDISDKTTSEQ